MMTWRMWEARGMSDTIIEELFTVRPKIRNSEMTLLPSAGA